MRGQPAAVAGEDDLVEVREAVVAELEGAQRRCRAGLASMPSQAANVITKSARLAYRASYAAVSRVTVLNVPVPPSALMTRLSVGSSFG